MTMVTAKPIYAKNLKNISSAESLVRLKVGMLHVGIYSFKLILMMILG